VRRHSARKGDAVFYLFGIIWVALLAAALVGAFEILRGGIRHH
jgi:uncharacterized membrane protein